MKRVLFIMPALLAMAAPALAAPVEIKLWRHDTGDL